MSIDEKCKDLAMAVKESSEYEELNSAHARLKLDVAAQDLINKIQRLQEEIQTAQMEGQPVDNAKVDEMKALHVSAQQNETLNRLFKCQEAFNALMQQISDKIGHELYSDQ